MIKVGILGASSPTAGELIRILINHPDVVLTSLYEPSIAGREVTFCHFGLIGEINSRFTDSIQLPRLDLVIICSPSDAADKIASSPALYPHLRVIDLTGRYGHKESSKMTLGVSEVNRKTLVRGATRAYIPSPAAVLAMIALYPLASHLLLNSDIDIAVSGEYDSDTADDEREITGFLESVQKSFSSKAKIHYTGPHDPKIGHGIQLCCTVDSVMTTEDTASLFEGIYDDHNFTFVTNFQTEPCDVEGTQKCLIYISKPEDNRLSICINADAAMRGSAGDAVHVMNLLFGLHERTGLALRALNCHKPCL